MLKATVVSMLCLISVLSTTPRALAQTRTNSLTPNTAERGATVAVSGLPQDAAKLNACLVPVSAGNNSCGPEALILERTGQELKFAIPAAAALGRYRVKLYDPATIAKEPPTELFPGDLTVKSPQVTVSSVFPGVPFPSPEAAGMGAQQACSVEAPMSRPGTFCLTVQGTGFSEQPHDADNILLIEDRPALIQCLANIPAEKGCTPGFFAIGRNGGREVVFGNIPGPDYRGIHRVKVQVGDTVASLPQQKPVTFSRFGEGTPLTVALTILGLLILIVFALLIMPSRGRTGRNLLAAFLIDEQTDSYSLSKFQFYCWITAAIFTYLYLSAALSLVQGSLELAPPPSGLATLLGTAAGTSVVSNGIANAKGSKGAGNLNPSLSDFFTHGGVVAPERLLFFLWTIIGVVSFLSLTLLRSPAEIQAIPSIPTDFQTLTGISALSYLGGKLARAAGPSIAAVALASTPPGSQDLLISGNGFSRSVVLTFSKGGTSTGTVPPDAVTVEDPKPGTQGADADVVNVLRVSQAKFPALPVPAAAGTSTQNRLVLVNKDGQKAEAAF